MGHWLKKRESKILECGIEIISSQSIMVHRFNLGSLICRCGKITVTQKESSLGWRNIYGRPESNESEKSEGNKGGEG